MSSAYIDIFDPSDSGTKDTQFMYTTDLKSILVVLRTALDWNYRLHYLQQCAAVYQSDMMPTTEGHAAPDRFCKRGR